MLAPQTRAGGDRRRASLDRFANRYQRRLPARVARCVATTDPGLIDDACQTAWSILARRDDIDLDERGFAWLSTVAIREGWRLARVTRDVPSGAFRGARDSPLEIGEPAALAWDPETCALAKSVHDDRVRAYRSLPDDQRKVLALQALGFSYDEMAALTARTAAAVNSRIARGRAGLRSTQ